MKGSELNNKKVGKNIILAKARSPHTILGAKKRKNIPIISKDTSKKE